MKHTTAMHHGEHGNHVMEHASHAAAPATAPGGGRSLRQLAFSATVHCLTGCGIGEVLGLVIATWLGWHDLPSILLAVGLAFVFGYGLTMRPLLASGMSFGAATRLALAADTASIVVMEVVDNGVMLLIPGAMDAHLSDPLFWGSLAAALAIAFVAAFPVNYWLIKRGRGHAVVHAHHGH
jgi:putative flippase GtrA